MNAFRQSDFTYVFVIVNYCSIYDVHGHVTVCMCVLRPTVLVNMLLYQCVEYDCYQAFCDVCCDSVQVVRCACSCC